MKQLWTLDLNIQTRDWSLTFILADDNLEFANIYGGNELIEKWIYISVNDTKIVCFCAWVAYHCNFFVCHFNFQEIRKKSIIRVMFYSLWSIIFPVNYTFTRIYSSNWEMYRKILAWKLRKLSRLIFSG